MRIENTEKNPVKHQTVKCTHIRFVADADALLSTDPQSPEVRTLSNSRLVTDAQEQTKQVLLEYCTSNYPNITVSCS